MSSEDKNSHSLFQAQNDPFARAQERLAEFQAHLTEYGIKPVSAPLHSRNFDKPSRDWLPGPEWISGWGAFEMFQLQEEPHEWAPPLARICKIIADQTDREETGLNFAFAELPPSHSLLQGFPIGSNLWFRALYELLVIKDGEEIVGWESLVTELYEWIGPWDNLRIRAESVIQDAIGHHWSVEQLSLPEAKQEPVWSFPLALAWIATREFLALARMPVFCRPPNESEEAVAENGVWRYATKALGWLHTEISIVRCECGAKQEFGYEAYKHCTCISVAWEELILHMGGLSDNVPELVFGLQEGWLSMTWPNGADEIRFLRSEIMGKWPARGKVLEPSKFDGSSIASIEKECADWLVEQFAADPEKRLSKQDFKEAALKRFPKGLSERGFNFRVWPTLASDAGRTSAGAKRKS